MLSLEETQKQIASYLDNRIANPVKILLIGQNHSESQLFCCQDFNPFEETVKIVQLISSREPKVSYRVLGEYEYWPCIRFFDIEHLPVIILIGNSDHGVRLYGFPLGYDLVSFLDTLIDFSIGFPQLQATTLQRLQIIKKPVHIKVFVNPSCIFCPVMSHLCNQFALASPYIRSDSVDTWFFQATAKAYNVTALPTTII
ncbi:MAG: hypothetical protein RML72_03080, partial [Bacteroidia bacterium]|nr:hypothetical protein [Bacteroidia bacterium]MDW8157845.1 hypothetical protein [Bacteroidia bacterium]